MTNIEYLDDIHAYLIDGVMVPSVSELIRFKFPEMYKNVPTKILKQKANYGTKTHDYIERFVKGEFTIEELNKKNIDPNIKIAVEQFELLRNKWAFYIKEMEQIVSWKEKYAGRYDAYTTDGHIIDLKTTSELHEEWLKWQLSLYALALGTEKDFHYCIWLPKGKAGKVIQIDTLPREEVEKLVDDYYRSLETN